MKIVADAHLPYVTDYFGEIGQLVLKPGRCIGPQDVKDADILLVRSVTRVDEKLLSGSKIKFVGSVTAGADHIDTHWLDQAGILWGIAKGFNAKAVADYVICVIAALQKRQWSIHEKPKVAVIGVGHAGSAVVKHLQTLNATIIMSDPLRAKQEKGFLSVPLSEISNVDLISLHVPLARTGPCPTFHFIDSHFLKRQNPGCILLNTSRGAVLSSDVLLQDGEHLVWCFDVWEHEPAINKAILARACIATPHIAGHSVQAKARGIEMIYRLACEKKILRPSLKQNISFPYQDLCLGAKKAHWQDIVLRVFDPLSMTQTMQSAMLPVKEHGQMFDHIRAQFTGRHEFAYSKVAGVSVVEEDKMILAQLGLLIE